MDEIRTIIYDHELHIEAYHFQGIMQKFPNHFHEHYVIGFIEKGKRHLCCRGEDFIITPGDLLLFNLRDNHSCEQIDGRTLDYRCLNICQEIMQQAVCDITGTAALPCFCRPVVFHSDIIPQLHELHSKIMRKEKDFRKEELFFFLIEELIKNYAGQTILFSGQENTAAVKAAAGFLERNYMRTITLDELSSLTGVSKYYLLRSFTRQKGISPYSYLETVRITQAKKLLAGGMTPSETALETGFSDQSHFSHFFKKFIGLTPGQYTAVFKELEKE
ncbi:MAG: AraC family transcriptional regulator [Treponema sp.]|nr:AraC family transcriptional regulator [Treponema sp.]